MIVAGADRSGTTLLYALLSSHTNISMVRRTNLWRWFYGSCGDLSGPANLDRLLDDLMRYPQLGVLEPDTTEIRKAFAARSPTYGELFSIMHEQHAARQGKPRWGDKSLHTEHYADEIFADLPEARILHMVRDPRDRHGSIMKRYPDRAKGLGSTMGRWLASVHVGERNLRRFGSERYRIVRYETLATAPEMTLRSICDFIHEPYQPAMLAMEGIRDSNDYTGNSSFGQIDPGVISTDSIGRYRPTLAPHTIATIQVLGRRWMINEYSADSIDLSRSEMTSLWVKEIPSSWMRTRGWLVNRRLSSLRRRKPPAHHMIAKDGHVATM